MSIAKDPAPVLDVAGADASAATAKTDSAAVGPEGLSAFLEGISLLMSAETRSEDEGADAVRLMTLHASKGLEFDTVFITGCEDKLIPFKTDENTGRAEDEEVRLFYVGLTRAKRKLFLCRAFKRQRFGRTDYCDPSPFLDVIRDALVGGGAGKPAAGATAAAADAAAGRENRLAAHLAASGARVAMGNSPAFRRGGGGGGRGGYGYGNGYARKDRTSANDRRGSPSDRSGGERVETFDPEATARRAARRAAAAKKAAEAAAKAAETRRATAGGDGMPRAAPKRRGRSTRE
jgi:hypothetical protein